MHHTLAQLLSFRLKHGTRDGGILISFFMFPSTRLYDRVDVEEGIISREVVQHEILDKMMSHTLALLPNF